MSIDHSEMKARVIGAGLAGCEAAWQLAQFGFKVQLFEMKPKRRSPAHHSDAFAELVCSNSLRSDQIENAVGLLKEEMRVLGSLIMRCADATRVPAGGALAVDRERFSETVTQSIKDHPCVEIIHEEVDVLPESGLTILATGPLTEGALYAHLMDRVGQQSLHFFDAAAPIIYSESIDRSVIFASSRYGKGGADYLNCPMNKEEYEQFHDALIQAQVAQVKDFDKGNVFEGCMPIEIMAQRGPDTIRFGPLKPVGLVDPRTGKTPYACVQLRQDNRSASMYNLVGFQTRLTYEAQKKVFRMIPGLQDAAFFRFGVMHRNSYICSPKVLSHHYAMKAFPHIYVAGQLNGVEGYVESAGSGLLAGIYAALKYKYDIYDLVLSDNTILGAMAAYVSDPAVADRFQPMNANFGIIAPFEKRIKNKKERYQLYAERSLMCVNQLNSTLSDLRANSI